MFTILNIGLILIMLLIAYWWANQGLFSALLHLFCVIAAGAIALAFWEPLTVNLLLRGTWFDDHAWGVSLVGLFAITLFGLRLAFDRLAPGNVDLPHWANMTFGGVIGAGAAVLTVGILIIGAGHVQADRDIMDFRGVARERGGQITTINNLWVPAHQVTSEFYEFLSAGSLRTNTPLRQYNPKLYQQATLIRDSYTSGGLLAGRVGLNPEAVSIEAFEVLDEGGADGQRYAVMLQFDRAAFDGGQQLVISQSQVRLIGIPTDRNAEPSVGFPDRWSQETDTGARSYEFDDPSHYITSVAGRESADVRIEFPIGRGEGQFRERPSFSRFYIQVKGVRFELPAPETVTSGVFATNRATLGTERERVVVEQVEGAVTIADDEIHLRNNIRNFNIRTAQLGMAMDVIDDYMVQGRAQVRRGGERVPRELRVDGIHEMEGTRIVQLDVSRGTTADLYGPARARVDEDAVPFLVDRNGNRYRPIGYVYNDTETIEVLLNPQRGAGTLSDLPDLPSAGDHTLKLVFRITEGVELTQFQFDSTLVANVDLVVR